MWKEREPEYARRKGQTMPEGVAGDRVLAEAEEAAAIDDAETPARRRCDVEAGVAQRTRRRGRRRHEARAAAPAPEARVRMDAPGNGASPSAIALERILALLGPRLDDARSLLDDATSRWRGDAAAGGRGHAAPRCATLSRELGLVTRDDWDELELRVAQLEHRLRLWRASRPQERP